MGAELVSVADGVFCWQHDVRDRLAANVGVVVDDEGLTLIDSGGLRESFVPLAARLAEFGRPVTRIMLTHEHPDHVGGAGAGAFGDAQVYSSRTTADALVNAPMIQVLQRLHPGVADQIGQLRHPARPQVLETGDVHGRVRVGVLAGHTDGDLVLHVDDAETTFAGDLCFFGTIPVGFSADFGTWNRASTP